MRGKRAEIPELPESRCWSVKGGLQLLAGLVLDSFLLGFTEKKSVCNVRGRNEIYPCCDVIRK